MYEESIPIYSKVNDDFINNKNNIGNFLSGDILVLTTWIVYLIYLIFIPSFVEELKILDTVLALPIFHHNNSVNSGGLRALP